MTGDEQYLQVESFKIRTNTVENPKATPAKTNQVSSKAQSKYIGLFLIIGSLLLFSLWLAYDFLPLIKTPTNLQKIKTVKPRAKSYLQKLWEQDITKMFKEQIFPKGIASIRMVRVFMLDENLHSQFKYLQTPFKQKKNGQNLLEVSFMSHSSELDQSEKLIIQYNLIDKDSGNMFWEHSRTLTLPEEMLAN